MTTFAKRQILLAIAEDERWIVRALALIDPGVDCQSVDESIAKAQHQVDRMRALL